MQPTVRIFTQLDDLLRFFAEKLITQLRESPADQLYSFALSGGSTPRILFDYLVSHFHRMIDWQRILIFWGDERCVGPESDESNYRMAKECLLDRVPIPAAQIFRLRGEADPVSEARRYERVVRKQVISIQDNTPIFDLMLLGLGEDGHTASIFPDRIGLFESEHLFDTTENPYTKQVRITATGKLINQARVVVLLAVGKNKAEMVSRILNQEVGWEKLPAARVRPVNGELIWLLDEAAARELIQPA